MTVTDTTYINNDVEGGVKRWEGRELFMTVISSTYINNDGWLVLLAVEGGVKRWGGGNC